MVLILPGAPSDLPGRIMQAAPYQFLKHKQHVATLILFIMLIGGGHLPTFMEDVLFYLCFLFIALLGYARGKALNVLLGCSTALFLLACADRFANLHLDVLYCLSLMILLLYNIHSILNFVIGSKEVSSDQIFALVNCYLFMGYFWALIYTLADVFVPGAFSLQAHQQANVDSFIYFSFTTMTTIGYGDITPTTTLTQRLCVTQAIMGQFYFALVVAYLINKVFQQSRKQDKAAATRP
jgi:hypothetical protein